MSPIDYAAASVKAIRDRNGGFLRFGLTQFDISLLHTLRRFNKGMRERELMLETTSADLFRSFMLGSLDRLLSHNAIIRTQYKRSVYYSITTEGRAVLDDINERLIKIVEEMYRNNPQP